MPNKASWWILTDFAPIFGQQRASLNSRKKQYKNIQCVCQQDSDSCLGFSQGAAPHTINTAVLLDVKITHLFCRQASISGKHIFYL